jgi:hypothetical protein
MPDMVRHAYMDDRLKKVRTLPAKGVWICLPVPLVIGEGDRQMKTILLAADPRTREQIEANRANWRRLAAIRLGKVYGYDEGEDI